MLIDMLYLVSLTVHLITSMRTFSCMSRRLFHIEQKLEPMNDSECPVSMWMRSDQRVFRFASAILKRQCRESWKLPITGVQ